MSMVIAGEEFQHILRVMNTNLDGRKKSMYALCSIRGEFSSPSPFPSKPRPLGRTCDTEHCPDS